MVKEYEEEYRLWEKCFGDSREYMDYYFTEKTKDNKMLRIFKENELVSMVHLNPYEIFWKGNVQNLYYIVGVCTDENHRKRGYMRKLLKESFKLMEEENCPFTYLMPAKREIYEPFDFQFIYTQKRLYGRLWEERADADGLLAAGLQRVPSKDIETGWKLEPFERLSEEEKEKTADFQNQKLSENFDLYAVRSRRYLERLSKEMQAAGGALLVLMDENGTVSGTLACMTESRNDTGICEAAESILLPEKTKTAAGLLKQWLLKKDRVNWELHFLETAFWETGCLQEFFYETRCYEKPIIMAKSLGEKDSLEELKNARIYLNEIV